ncbi:MAG: cupredoxin domain-containing protein [Methylovirgula sp.]|jgi:plastocyanin
MFHFLRFRSAAAALLLLMAAAMPGLAADAQLASQVSVENFAFTPQVLRVKAGTTVTFVNHDDIPHSVISETYAFHSHALDTDDTFTFTFAKPGEYPYVCGLHPHMKGKIVVVP